MLRAASAAAQAASPTARAVAGVLRGQEEKTGDWIQDLAAIFAPRPTGMIEAVRPTGSFNPLIAEHLKGGKDDEGRVYRGALADVQG